MNPAHRSAGRRLALAGPGVGLHRGGGVDGTHLRLHPRLGIEGELATGLLLGDQNPVQADVENAAAGLVAAQRGFDAAQASLRQAEANDLKAQDDVTRYKPLAAKDEIPQQRYTQAVESQKATAAAVEAARASVPVLVVDHLEKPSEN